MLLSGHQGKAQSSVRQLKIAKTKIIGSQNLCANYLAKQYDFFHGYLPIFCRLTHQEKFKILMNAALA